METANQHPQSELPPPPEKPGGWLNFYTLPPIAAAVVSLIMSALMLKFAFRQVADLELSSIPLPSFEEPARQEEDLPASEALTGSHSMIAGLFTPEIQYWASRIASWSADWSLDPNLVATVMQIESCGHPSVVSSAGATGLFQVMPFHFKPGENHSDPDTNAMRGLSYLSRSLNTHSGDATLALAGYNGGIGTSQRSQSSWPDETRRYTYWGSGIYYDASTGRNHSDRLDEWLSSGGASLCRRAAGALGIEE